MTDMTDEQAVARAIRDAFPHMVVGSRGPVPWDELGPTDRETWVRMARAAIACIRGRWLSDEAVERAAGAILDQFFGGCSGPELEDMALSVARGHAVAALRAASEGT